MIIRMMYVLPMILGRTYDVKRNTVGVDIFPVNDTHNPRVIEESFYRSSYKTVESSSDVRELLDVNGDLSLSIKAGTLKASGIGAFLKSTATSHNSVDVLIRVGFRTISHSLPHDARPVDGWSRSEFLGTHFVQSVLYGGDLIARIRFRSQRAEDMQEIRAVVKASLAGGSALDLMGEGTLETLDKQLSRKARMEIDYFATVPLEGVPNTIDDLRALVRNFEAHVKKVNDGIGVPVEVELRELATFDRKFEYIKNLELETELEFFEEYFDDLLSTKLRLRDLVHEYPNELAKEDLKEVSSLNERMGVILRKFYDAISELDLSQGAKQLGAAKDAYREGKGLGLAGKFRRELNKILKKVNSNLELSKEHAVVFTLFGASNCTPSTTLLYSGYLASSPRNQIGSGHNLLCMPKAPAYMEEGWTIKGGARVSGVKYGLMSNAPFRVGQDKAMSGVACAVCLSRSQTVFTFVGEFECAGGWRGLSSGHVMSATDVQRSQWVCVDGRMDAHRDGYMGHNDQSLNFATLANGTTFVPCVTCAK